MSKATRQGPLKRPYNAKGFGFRVLLGNRNETLECIGRQVGPVLPERTSFLRLLGPSVLVSFGGTDTFSPEQNGPDPPGDGRTRLPAGDEDGRRGRREEGEMS